MEIRFTTLEAGKSLIEQSRTLDVPVSVLQAITRIDDPSKPLASAWTIPDPKQLLDAEKLKGLPLVLQTGASATTSGAAGQLKAAQMHQKVTIEHENRGDAGLIGKDEERHAARMRLTGDVASYRTGRDKIFWIPEGLFIVEVANNPRDPAVSVDEAIVPPGVRTALHSLVGLDERYLITSGSGVMEVGGVTQRVNPGDVVRIPAGTKQRITNDGSELLRFWCVVTDRFVPETYVHHEDATIPYAPHAEVAAGQSTRGEKAKRDETFLITGGKGSAIVNGKRADVAGGELVRVRAGESFSFDNRGGSAPFVVQRYTA